MARIVLIDQSDYRLIVKESGTITLDPGPNGEVYVTGKLVVDSNSEFKKNLIVQGDLAVNSGNITSESNEVNLFEENVTTINFGAGATDIQIGSDGGITTINNNLQVDLDGEFKNDLVVQGDLAVNNGNITSTANEVNLFEETVTDINVGSTNSIVNIKNDLQVNGNTYLKNHTIIGDSSSDTITFISDITSNIIPNTSETYTLGVPNQAWEALYTNKISNELNKNIAITPQGTGVVDIDSTVNITKNLTVGGMAHIVGDIFATGKSYGTFPIVPNILYVTTEGSDTNDGTGMDSSRACRTITGAIRSPFYRPGTSIKVAPGRYLEDNPLLLKPYTSIIGSDLRTTTIEPINKTQDLFHVTSSTYIAQMQFLNGRSGIIDPMLDRGAYTIAFPNTAFSFTGTVVEDETIIKNISSTEFIPIGADILSNQSIFPVGTIVTSVDSATQISVSRKATQSLDNTSFTTGPLTIYKSPYIQNCTNQSGPWLKDGTMFVPNQTIQVPKLVGQTSFGNGDIEITVNITKGTGAPVPGMKINTAPQDIGLFHARTLLLANKAFIQDQIVTWISNQIDIAVTNDNVESIWFNFGEKYTPYIQEKCRRDVGIILENVLYDTCFGGNSKSIESGLAYYNGVISIIPGQEQQTAASLTELDSLIGIIIANNPDNPINPSDNRISLTNVSLNVIEEFNSIRKQFECTNTGIRLLPGKPIEISGVLSGTGTIIGYQNPSTYYIDTTDGRTIFTLRDANGYVIDILSGTTDGLTFKYGLEQTFIGFLGQQGLVAKDIITKNIGIINTIIQEGPESEQVPDIYYSTGPEFGLVCAEILLEENRSFIQKEVSAYIDATYPFLFFDDSNEDICKRDIETILNAVLDDITFKTNYRSLISGIAYTRSYSANVISSQKKQTITVLNIARDKAIELANNILTKTLIFNNFKIITDIINNEGDYASPELLFNNPINTDIKIINAARLLEKNKPFLIAEIMAQINYQVANQIAPFNGSYNLTADQKIKCSRDTGYFIDALIYDLLYGGNSQSISAASAYFLGTTSYISNQEQQTASIYSYLKDIIGYIVTGTLIIPTVGNNEIIQYTTGIIDTDIAIVILQDLLDTIIGIIDATSSSPSITLPTYQNGVNFTATNSSISVIKSQLTTIKNQTIETFKTIYNFKEKCERDIGYVVDAVSQDVLLGGNSKSVDAAITYYNALGFVANGEAEYTARAFDYAKELMLLIIQNTNFTAVSGYTYPYQGPNGVTPSTINNPQYVKGAIAYEAIERNLTIISEIIRTGIKDQYVRYQGTPLFAATGVSADDVKEASEIESVVDNGGNSYTITLNKPAVGIGTNSNLYFGYSDVYPLTDAMVEDRCAEYGFEINAWNQRKYDQYGSMGGMLIDGAVISPNSPIRSFVADAFTQVNQGGRGVRATRRGYVQLVSVFTIFSSISMQSDSGAIMSITNANANFGDYCMISKGYGPKEFSGTVYNPTAPPLYPSGKYPIDGNVNIFVPDAAYRPHISLIMEVEPPDNYINVQNKTGFLTATVTTDEIIEGSLTIDNIEVFDMYIGQTIYIKDQFGSYSDEDTGQPYLQEGTTIVDVGPSKIYLSRPVNRGKSVPDNPTFFTIFTCGKAYYTVLTSSPAALPIRSDGRQLTDGELVLPPNQKSKELAVVIYINELVGNIILNTPVATPLQSNISQVINPIYASGESSLIRINQLFEIIYGIVDLGKTYLTDNNIVINKKEIDPTISNTDAASLILLNLNFIAAEVEALMDNYVTEDPTFTYNKSKCLRDAKLISSKVAEDLTTGGNYNSCYSGLSYYATAGTYHIVSLNDNVRDTSLFQDGAIVNFYQRSYMTASGYLFEYVGAGSNYGALPTVGRADPIQGREVNMLDGGKVFFTSTDQNGDFRIGPGLVINQAAGVLSGRTFQKSLFAEMTPFILALE